MVKSAPIHALYEEYAAKVNHPIKYAWYDAMTYKYGRYHEDGLGEYNYQFMQKEGEVPAEFLYNFNWNKERMTTQ